MELTQVLEALPHPDLVQGVLPGISQPLTALKIPATRRHPPVTPDEQPLPELGAYEVVPHPYRSSHIPPFRFGVLAHVVNIVHIADYVHTPFLPESPKLLQLLQVLFHLDHRDPDARALPPTLIPQLHEFLYIPDHIFELCPYADTLVALLLDRIKGDDHPIHTCI